ncbi:hypothetical protein [Paracoccus sp. 228]|uniref:hypothetical protein n=1 Tax=Paracoccus sp. 228 TaxID=1192054 RepID=UPI0005E33937|nr:hypothetical protein [Paracoccus sp. 228]KIX18484.1 hypothetical protein SY26_09455 [Paracoccus sp. 228]
MLFATAGTRLFIADRDTTPVPAGAWVEIAETEAVGFLGSQWNMAEAEIAYMGAPDVEMEVVQHKRSIRRLPMQVVMGNDPTDPGQRLLWAAHYSTRDFQFRLAFPDGTNARQWPGLVTAMSEVFDTANNVMRLQADILPTAQPTMTGA